MAVAVEEEVGSKVRSGSMVLRSGEMVGAVLPQLRIPGEMSYDGISLCCRYGEFVPDDAYAARA